MITSENLDESLQETQGWLARLAAQHITPDTMRRGRLTEQVDQLWAQWLRGLRRTSQRSRELTGLSDEAPVVELPGVRYLPWPGWPGKTLGQATPGQGGTGSRTVKGGMWMRCCWWIEQIEVRCCEKVRCRGSVYVCLCRNVPARICLGRNRCKH
ncbi:hypothetical protein QFB12_001600 [Salmonella enterica]|nr:hypothetical protein [Salmonella enterica]